MKADVSKVERYKWLALYGKNERIKRKNTKKYYACFTIKMVPFEIASGVTLYRQEMILKER